MVNSKALFFAAIIPPKEIRKEILQLKLEIKERFNAAHALKLPAHITIVPPFWLKNDQEHDLVKKLETITSNQDTFPVKLKNFGHFGQRVIFINVEDHQAVKNFHKEVTAGVSSFLQESQKSSIHPHVTLGTRDLSRESFKKAWDEFKTRSYLNSFIAGDLSLLKHNGKNWNIFKEFSFNTNIL
jgi:2'-5' RNA ligase